MHSSLLFHLYNDTELCSTFRWKGMTTSRTAHLLCIVLLYIADIGTVISIHLSLPNSLEFQITCVLYTLYLSPVYSNFALEY